MIKINEYYKLVNGDEIWFKITKITSDKYYIEYEIYYITETAGHGKGDFKKDFLDHRKKTGELKELSDDEKMIFELGMND